MTDLHKKQKSKNYAMLAAIMLFVALTFVVAMIRMGG